MKKTIAFVMAIMMVMTLFAGCGAKAEPADANVVKIGMSGPLTGGAAVYGTAVKAGMEIAVEEINALGGLQIEFNGQDDEADGEKGVSAYNNLKDWGMQILAGAVTSGASLAIASEAAADKMFMLTPSASMPEVATTGDNIFQMCFTDPNQGASAAELMAQKWADATIGVIYDNSDEYSAGLYAGFDAKAKELNLNVAVVETFAKGYSDLNTQVSKCKEAGCDLVFLPIYYTEASLILTYADTIGYEPTFFGCDGMDGVLAVEGFNTELAEGLALMTPFDANATDDATVSFVTKYVEKTGEVPNQFAADAYDVIYAIYAACVEKGIDGNTSAEDACAKLTEWFVACEGFDGLTGKGMTWDESGMISKIPAAVVITDGVYVPMN